jgi:uncharacterized SAM-binding protein YcdF (DUF218 family)
MGVGREGIFSVLPQYHNTSQPLSYREMTPEIITLAKKLWSYHHVYHTIEKSDCILALGSHDLRVANRAAELYLQGMAPLIIFSGGLGNFTKEIWTKSEADLFAGIAIQMGVPSEAILIENKSTNTGENILFTQRLLEAQHLHPESFIVVQKPYMERRAFATFKKLWPDKIFTVTSPQISFDDYPTPAIPLEKVVNIMVGDLQRIRIYPERGFQVYQEIPADVWDAFERLVALGFDKHLMQ